MEIEQRLQQLIVACQKVGVKVTQQRLEIFKSVAGSTEHPDAAAVFEQLRSQMPTLSLDTVYRNLWLFKDLGLINTLGTAKESTRFDANTSPHHHFICDQCGRTHDINTDLYDQVPDFIHQFGQAQKVQVEIHGTCKTCM